MFFNSIKESEALEITPTAFRKPVCTFCIFISFDLVLVGIISAKMS